MTFVPAAATFALPRPRSHFSRMAFGGAHEDFGLPQQQLSTMGYPRKSYPHRCSPPCAKRSRPRACARVYNISFARRPLPGSVRVAVGKSPRRCGPVFRAAERRVGEGEGKGGRHPRAVPRPCPCVLPARACLRPSFRPLMGVVPCILPASARPPPSPYRLCAESLCAKAEVHKVIPAPARAFSPRQLVYGRAPARLWANCRAQGGGGRRQRRTPPCTATRPCPCALPAATYLPPRPRRLNGSPGSAGGRENDRMAHRRTTTPTYQTPRGNDTCTIRVPRRKGAQSVVHNLYFSSSRPASFCTTFPQSCTDRPATRRKEHKSSLEGLIFRVLPPLSAPFSPKAIVQNTPAAPPFFPRKTPRFAPTRNRARTFASAGRDNTPRPAHSSRFQ